MPIARRIGALALVAVLSACGGGGDSGGPTGTNTNTTTDVTGGSATATSVDVNMPGERFVPNKIDIAQNGTIHFVFSGLAHDVRFNSNPLAPDDILVTSNSTVNRTFTNKGTIAFICTLHANMTGTVTVH